MPSNKPWLDGPTTKERAKARMVQGAAPLLIGLLATLGTYVALGVVWIGTIILAVGGFFWFVTGLITYLTDIE